MCSYESEPDAFLEVVVGWVGLEERLPFVSPGEKEFHKQ